MIFEHKCPYCGEDRVSIVDQENPRIIMATCENDLLDDVHSVNRFCGFSYLLIPTRITWEVGTIESEIKRMDR